jgi:hypothetical protein
MVCAGRITFVCVVQVMLVQQKYELENPSNHIRKKRMQDKPVFWGVHIKADNTIVEIDFNIKDDNHDKETAEVHRRDDNRGNDGRNCC